MYPFHALLSEYLNRAGAPLRVEFANGIGVGKSHITDICNGRRTPPLDKIERMIAVLQLSPPDAAAFTEAAHAAHSTDYMREALARARERYEHLDRLVADSAHVRPEDIATYGPDAAATIAQLRQANRRLLDEVDQLKGRKTRFTASGTPPFPPAP